MTDQQIAGAYRKIQGIVSTRRVRDADKADVMQDAMMRLWSKWNIRLDKKHWRAWAERVVWNMVTNYRRKLPPPMFDIDVLRESLHPRTVQNHSLLDFMDIIKALPEHYQRVLFLYYFAGYGMKEVAEILGWTYTKAWSVRNRAIKRLRAEYGYY